MLEKYANIRFTPDSLKRLEHVAQTMKEYNLMGYDLTVRQLFYRLVSKNLIENTMKAYKGFVGLVTDGRMAGLLDWSTIVDRARRASRPQSWEDIKSFIQDVKHDFMIDKWKDQDVYIEVMVEKDALAGVLGPVCSKWDVVFAPNKGYSSATMMYRAAKRIRRHIDNGKKAYVLYLGDHDPSGIDMTRDVRHRIQLLGGNPMDIGVKGSTPYPLDDVEVKIIRVALNEDQITKYAPPENPCKLTDSRAPDYVRKFGDKSWELDALDAPVLDALVSDQIKALLDMEKWDAAVEREEALVKQLDKAVSKIGQKKTRKKK